VNYRHAYHAGNFADVVKHSVTVALLESLKRKSTPFAYLDTHAGSGRYSLSSTEAVKTLEFAAGIKPLLNATDLPIEFHAYIKVVRALNCAEASATSVYPGSPLIASTLMRPMDRLILCELQAEEARKLKSEFIGDARVACHQRDGYEALGAFLPFKEKRGLVLIDPPYEAQLAEFDRILEVLAEVYSRAPAAQIAVWYPIKLRQDIEYFYRRAVTLPYARILLGELCLHAPNTALRLNGCGMLLINPPFQFETTLSAILSVLAKTLEQSRYGSTAVRWLKSTET